VALSIAVLGTDPTATDAPSLGFTASRIVIGRAEKTDLPLPEPSVSQHHAAIQREGVDYVLVDLGSVNGTFVGGVRLTTGAPRIVRNGDRVRVGRVWLELRLDDSLPEHPGPNATREIAMNLVGKKLERAQDSLRIRVVEGPDRGRVLLLNGDGFYKIGRASSCELVLTDPDLSREHVKIYRKGARVTVRDLSSKNGAFLGSDLVGSGRSSEWPAKTMLRLAGSVLALEDPLAELIAELARQPEEIVQEPSPAAVSVDAPAAQGPLSPVAETGDVPAPVPEAPGAAAPIAELPTEEAVRPTSTTSDRLLFAVLAGVVLASIAGLAWILLRW
jgi:pSer/pThr/pTyr-binding forkhead associated (FHA) protein